MYCPPPYQTTYSVGGPSGICPARREPRAHEPQAQNAETFRRVLLTGSIDTLIYLTLICGIAIAVMGALDAIRSIMLSRIGAWLERTLRFDLLAGVLRVAFERCNSCGPQFPRE